jgi:hypothetical protein
MVKKANVGEMANQSWRISWRKVAENNGQYRWHQSAAQPMYQWR